VNRFNIAGRSYKVIPQIKRTERLNPQQLENIYVTGTEWTIDPAEHSGGRSSIRRSLARSTRMQQLNAVTISGVPTRSLDTRAKVSRRRSAQDFTEGIRPRLHRRIATAAH